MSKKKDPDRWTTTNNERKRQRAEEHNTLYARREEELAQREAMRLLMPSPSKTPSSFRG